MAKTLVQVNTDTALDLSNEIEQSNSRFNSFINSLQSEDRENHLEKISSIKRESRIAYDLELGAINEQKQIDQPEPSVKEPPLTQPKSEPIAPKKEEPNIFEQMATAAAGTAVVGTATAGEFMAPTEVSDGGRYSEKDFYIGRTGDTDGQQTGLNMHLPGGIGAPIYAPVDLIYVSKGTDGNPSVGLQGTADARGPSGNGFGYYASYRFIKDGKNYEVLMGHLSNMGYRGTNENQLIPKGTLIGYQGASGLSVRGDGSNKPYPHISLHVNGIGFTASNSVLLWFANSLRGGQGTTQSAPPKPKPITSPSQNKQSPTVSTVQPAPPKPKPITPPSQNKQYPTVSTVQQKPQPQSPQVASSSSPAMLNTNSSGLTREQLFFATV